MLPHSRLNAKSHVISGAMAPDPGPIESAAPAAAPAVEPVVAAVPESPVVEAAAPAPAPEVPVEVAPVAEPTAAPEVPVAEEPKVEVAAEPEAPKAEEPDVPTYGEFKMPEGIAAEPEQIKAFTDLLGNVDVRTQDGAQALLDLHTSSLKQFAETYAKDLQQKGQDAFQDMRRDWREDFYKRAGNRSDTMANDAKWAIQELFPKTEERKAFTDLLTVTGSGDNFAMVSALSRVARRLRERSAPATPLSAKPPTMDKAQRRYNRPAPR